jgi:3-oxoacyl-[acyl-carrier protein] reductase
MMTVMFRRRQHDNHHASRSSKMKKLNGKVAVVTGASKGIGAEVAKQLAAEGAAVVVNFLSSQDGADRVVAAIVKAGGKAIAVGADVSNEAEIAMLFAETKKTYGRLDILINNAGVYAFAPLESCTVDEYHRQFNLNVLGLLLTTKAALGLFPDTGGSIVNLGSVVSTYAPPSSSIAAGSKASVDTITKSLAKELGPRGIRVNSINPGVIRTEGLISGGLADSEFERHAVSLTPLGRVGQPIDVALPVVFLASEDARWITGQTLVVSGGQGT